MRAESNPILADVDAGLAKAFAQWWLEDRSRRDASYWNVVQPTRRINMNEVAILDEMMDERALQREALQHARKLSPTCCRSLSAAAPLGLVEAAWPWAAGSRAGGDPHLHGLQPTVMDCTVGCKVWYRQETRVVGRECYCLTSGGLCARRTAGRPVAAGCFLEREGGATWHDCCALSGLGLMG